MEHSLLSWRKVSTELVADCKVFSVNRNHSCLENGTSDSLHSFYVLHPHNWVNVIPITPFGEIVMVEQYRHGIEHVTLEIPGGMVDPTDSSSAEAGVRELLEETGYISDDWKFIGRNHPNPAIQSNICDTYLARNVRQIEQPSFDSSGTELISLRLVPLDRIPELIKEGVITHALVIVAFHLLQLHEFGTALYCSRQTSGAK